MISLRLPERGKLSRREIDAFMEDAFRMTLGRLLGELRRQSRFAELVEQELDQAREARNWLAHRYFRDRAVQFISPVGRVVMLGELDDATNLFLRTNDTLERLSTEIGAANGVSENAVRREYDQLLKEVEEWRPD